MLLRRRGGPFIRPGAVASLRAIADDAPGRHGSFRSGVLVLQSTKSPVAATDCEQTQPNNNVLIRLYGIEHRFGQFLPINWR